MEKLLPDLVKERQNLMLFLRSGKGTFFKILTFLIFTLVFGITQTRADEVVAGDGSRDWTVSGRVVDEHDKALPGVTVRLIGGAGRTVATDVSGHFEISVTNSTDSLRFTFVGYAAQTLSVGNMKVFHVKLMPATDGALNEVVVVAFGGRQKKITTIGAQSSIVVADLKQPVANLSNSIAGRIAGVIGVQRSGEPGYDGSQIFIRGISTFTNASPLILVDGVERAFSNIDPEDIASFTILKDASATAVYGVRGANGIILIETKKGKAGKPVFNAQFNQGITAFTRTPQFADGVTYLQMANEAFRNSNPNNTSPLYSDERLQKTADGSDPDLYPNVNWVKEMFKSHGQNRKANLNTSGGSEKAQYYLSLGYYDENGLYKTDELAKYNSSIKFTRYNFTSNLSVQVFSKTKVDFGASGWISDINSPGKTVNDIWTAALTMPPTVIPARYSNGYIAQTRAIDVPNPYDLLTQSGYASETKSQLWSNIRVTQNLDWLTKGLSLYGMFSFDNLNSYRLARTKTVDTYLATGRDIDNNLIFEQTRIGSSYLNYDRKNGGSRQFYTEAAFTYNNSFGRHDVSGLILYNQSDKSDAFADDFLNSIPNRYQGIAARATYAFDNRYMAEFNLGYNGSETFAPGKRFGFFPAYGIGWVPSQEKFFAGIKNAIQFLKLRASYGTVGNSNIGGRRFAFISTVANTNGYSFGKNNDNTYSGLDIGDYAVEVAWEKAKKLNIGLELHTWQDAISLVVDVFQENRTGIYLQRGDLPAYGGIRNAPYGNLGEIRNRGIDGTVSLYKKLSTDWSLEFRGNLTWNKAIVISNGNVPKPYPWQQAIGRPLGQRFGKIALGLFQSQEEIANSPVQTGDIKPGDIKYKDLNSDGKIDSYDEGPIGNGSIPAIVYGFGPSITYKGFAIGGWIKGISSVDIFMNGEGLQPFQKEGIRGNVFSNITDRWTPENNAAHPTYPRLTYPSTANSNYDNSSWWIKNGAFLRIQNIELSYTFQKKAWLQKMGLSNFRVYLMGYNVATLTGFKMWDVELGDGRGAQYPLLKTYNLGIDCRF
ncbi:SusC/RagA family TonB-linked outer membrane protein [Mucilaginibacter angelicae]|uniref:SusC/RagA family TonB-linked outer membrane protein n=1 Tax=Mucilaginibacter angelicae TaxID=869718 RepID=A0ABV6KZX6_9SPHI